MSYRNICFALTFSLAALLQVSVFAVPRGDKKVYMTPVATGLVSPVRLTHAGDGHLFCGGPGGADSHH